MPGRAAWPGTEARVGWRPVPLGHQVEEEEDCYRPLAGDIPSQDG
jgi:hypothetical protein